MNMEWNGRMKKSEVIKKIKEDLKFFTGPHDDLKYSTYYVVLMEDKVFDDGKAIKVPTGEEFVITIKLKRE